MFKDFFSHSFNPPPRQMSSLHMWTRWGEKCARINNHHIYYRHIGWYMSACERTYRLWVFMSVCGSARENSLIIISFVSIVSSLGLREIIGRIDGDAKAISIYVWAHKRRQLNQRQKWSGRIECAKWQHMRIYECWMLFMGERYLIDWIF